MAVWGLSRCFPSRALPQTAAPGARLAPGILCVVAGYPNTASSHYRDPDILHVLLPLGVGPHPRPLSDVPTLFSGWHFPRRPRRIIRKKPRSALTVALVGARKITGVLGTCEDLSQNYFCSLTFSNAVWNMECVGFSINIENVFKCLSLTTI